VQIDNAGAFGGAAGLTTPDDNSLATAGPDPMVDFTSPVYGMPVTGCNDSTGGTNWAASGAASGAFATTTAGSHSVLFPYGYNGQFSFKIGCGIIVPGGPLNAIPTPTGTYVSVHGVAGSTIYNYKICAVDNFLYHAGPPAYVTGMGCSAATAAFSTTTGNATLNEHNYNDLLWTWDTTTTAYEVFTDTLTPGTFYPTGMAYSCGAGASMTTCGYVDDGVVRTQGGQAASGVYFLPQTPPVTATAESLVTTITNIVGTTITIAAPAITTSVGGYTQNDESIFLENVMASVQAYGPPSRILIPTGTYNFSHIPQQWSNTSGPHTNASVLVRGLPQFFAGPMMFPLNASWDGEGPADSQIGTTVTCTTYSMPTWVPALIVLNHSAHFGNICGSFSQDGIVVNPNGSSSYHHDLHINRSGALSGSTFLINGNVIFLQGENTVLTADGYGAENIQLRYQNDGASVIIAFNNLGLVGRAVGEDCSFGFGSGECYAENVSITGNSSYESAITASSPGILNVDGGFYGYLASDLTVSDYIGIPPYGCFSYVNGYQSRCPGFMGTSINSPGPSYGQQGAITAPVESYLYGGVNGSQGGVDYGAGAGPAGFSAVGLASGSGANLLSLSFWRPFTTVSKTTGGSLSAGNYWLITSVTDINGYESAGSVPVEEASVASSGQITVVATEEWPGGTGCRAYIGTTSGGENGYFTVTFAGTTCTVVITTLSGITLGTPQYSNNALRGWLSADAGVDSCIPTCGGAGTSDVLGIGLTAAQWAARTSSYKVWVPSLYSFGNVVVAGISDGRTATAVTTGATATLGGTYSKTMVYNEEATAATGVTYTLPTAVAGKAYCVFNANNGSAPDTGVLTLQTSGSGQYIIFTDGTLSASGGYVSSSGAALDVGCVTGIDSTHWMFVLAGNGIAWSKH
jgi:hypothetical protein